MKKKSRFFSAALSLSLTFSASLVFAGDKGGNGGDPNEMIFKSIATNIGGWINSGNSDALALPEGISARHYQTAMLGAIRVYHISFTSKSVLVNGTEKTCKNFVGRSGLENILCQAQRFAAASTEQQYRLVHHELAGLAKLEVGNGPDSDYRISDQISGFLRSETVLRLPVSTFRSSKRPAYANLQPYFVNPYGAGRITMLSGSCDEVDKRSVITSLMTKMVNAVATDLATSGREVADSSAMILKVKENRRTDFDTFKTDVIAKFAGRIQLTNGIVLDVGFLNGLGSVDGGKDSAVAFTFTDRKGSCEFYNATDTIAITGPGGSGAIRIIWRDVWPDPDAGSSCSGVMCI